MTDKVAFKDIEAEQMVIGAILQDADSLLRASDIIEIEDIYSEKHRLIYGACLDLYQIGEKIDVATVRDRIRTKGQEDQIGGINYLLTCIDSTPTAANIRVHSRIVKDAAIKRSIKKWIVEQEGHLGNGYGPAEILSKMEAGIVELSEQIRTKKDPNVAGIIIDIEAYWKGLKDKTQRYIETDNKSGASIPGYFPGHLWMIGGYTSAGKSTFLAQTIIDIGESGGRTLVFSLEDSREEKTMKLIANLTDIPQKYLLTGEIYDHQQSKVMLAISRIKDQYRPIIYDDIRTTDEIRLKTKKHKLQDDIQIVAVDYAQNLRGSGSLYERMSDAAEKLFSMGRELGVTVIVLSQVNNESVKEESPVIGLKGAGELAAAADIVLWLKRNKGFGKERELDVEIRKNRPFGVTGMIPMQFSEKYTKIDRR